jgi:hypothetical protein
MQFIPQDTSPFLILWYVFLGFLAIVIVVNVISATITAILEWRTNALIKKSSVTGLKIKRKGAKI